MSGTRHKRFINAIGPTKLGSLENSKLGLSSRGCGFGVPKILIPCWNLAEGMRSLKKLGLEYCSSNGEIHIGTRIAMGTLLYGPVFQ